MEDLRATMFVTVKLHNITTDVFDFLDFLSFNFISCRKIVDAINTNLVRP